MCDFGSGAATRRLGSMEADLTEEVVDTLGPRRGNGSPNPWIVNERSTL